MVIRFWCVAATVVLLGARQAGAFLAPSLVPQSLASRRASTACKLHLQLRTPLQRAGVSLAAKRGGILEENYVDPYVVLGVPKQVCDGYFALFARVHAYSRVSLTGLGMCRQRALILRRHTASSRRHITPTSMLRKGRRRSLL